jgi:hypothetical protein
MEKALTHKKTELEKQQTKGKSFEEKKIPMEVEKISKDFNIR